MPPVSSAAHRLTHAAAASATALLTALLLLLAATPALAHDGLANSDPADGATVETLPAKVTLTFDEAVRAPSVIVVTDPAGTRVEQGATQIRDKSASVAMKPGNVGSYTVAFRVVSADGHAVTGQLKFTYRMLASATSAAPAPAAKSHQHHQQGGVGYRWLVIGITGTALLGVIVVLWRRSRIDRLVGATGRGAA